MSNRNKKEPVEGEWSQLEKEENTPGKEVIVLMAKEHQRFYDKLRAKVEEFVNRQAGERGGTAAKYVLLAPDLFVLLARLLQDKRVSMKSKAVAGLAVAYFISPLDLIPEAFTGPLGFLDDIVLAAYALNKILSDVDKSILLEHWNGEEGLLDTIQELLAKAEELVDTKVLRLLKNLLNK